MNDDSQQQQPKQRLQHQKSNTSSAQPVLWSKLSSASMSSSSDGRSFRSRMDSSPPEEGTSKPVDNDNDRSNIKSSSSSHYYNRGAVGLHVGVGGRQTRRRSPPPSSDGRLKSASSSSSCKPTAMPYNNNDNNKDATYQSTAMVTMMMANTKTTMPTKAAAAAAATASTTSRRNSLTVVSGRSIDDTSNSVPARTVSADYDYDDDDRGGGGILENYRRNFYDDDDENNNNNKNANSNRNRNSYGGADLYEHQSSSGSLGERRKKKRSVMSLSCQRWMMKLQMMVGNSGNTNSNTPKSKSNANASPNHNSPVQIGMIAIISLVISTIIFLIVVGLPYDDYEEHDHPNNRHSTTTTSTSSHRHNNNNNKNNRFFKRTRARTAEEYYLEQSGSLMNFESKDGSKRNHDDGAGNIEMSTIEAGRLNEMILGGPSDLVDFKRRFASRTTFPSNTPRVVQIEHNDVGDDIRRWKADNELLYKLDDVHPLEPRDVVGFLGWEVKPDRMLDFHFLDLRQSNPKLLKQPETLDKGDCQAVAPEWQNSHNPTCVLIHEASSGWQNPYTVQRYGVRGGNDKAEVIVEEEAWDISTGPPIDRNETNEQLRLINAGNFRHVWMIRDGDGVTKRVMKTLRVDAKTKKFDLRNFDRHRRDAIAFAQLQTSPLVVNIYGYCSNSAIFDYADGGDLLDIFRSRPDVSKKELLQIAYNASKSIHDAHHFDALGRPTMVHTDIKTDQFILQDGYYKLSDFNRVRFLMWNQKRNLPCGFRVERNGGEYRSPEEYAYQVENEKVDVYSLGNVLYFLLTRQEPWVDYNLKHVYELVLMGQRPKIPDKVRNNTGVFEETMIRAMEMAWIHDRSQRPSALEVAKTIEEGLSRLES